MLHVIFIAQLNQTNSIILESLDSNFDADITLLEPELIFKPSKPSIEDVYNLVIFDLNTSLGFGGAPVSVQRLNQHFSDTPLIVITPHQGDRFIQPLVDAGANGVIPIAPTEEELTLAVNDVLKGNTHISAG